MANNNVLIPIELLNKIIKFLDKWKFPTNHDLEDDHAEILWTLMMKKQKSELRKAYIEACIDYDADNSDWQIMEFIWKRRIEPANEFRYEIN